METWSQNPRGMLRSWKQLFSKLLQDDDNNNFANRDNALNPIHNDGLDIIRSESQYSSSSASYADETVILAVKDSAYEASTFVCMVKKVEYHHF